MRFRGRGFTDPTRPVYAHYVFAGKSQKTIRLGLPTGDCGLFSVKRKQFPFKKSPQVGVWTIQFDQEPHYDPKAAVRVPLTIRSARDQAEAGSGSLTRVRVEAQVAVARRRPRCGRRLANSPLSRPSASGSTRCLEITRLSGRAPYAGS